MKNLWFQQSLEVEGNPSEEELTVEIVNPDAVSMETEDGGVVIDFTGELTEDLIGPDHDAKPSGVH